MPIAGSLGEDVVGDHQGVETRMVEMHECVDQVATQQRACTCICPVEGHGSGYVPDRICRSFIRYGETYVLVRSGARQNVICQPCAEAIRLRRRDVDGVHRLFAG